MIVVVAVVAFGADPCGPFTVTEDPFAGKMVDTRVNLDPKLLIDIVWTPTVSTMWVQAVAPGPTGAVLPAGTAVPVKWMDGSFSTLATVTSATTTLETRLPMAMGGTSTLMAPMLEATVPVAIGVDEALLSHSGAPEVLRIPLPSGSVDWTLSKLEQKRWMRAMQCIAVHAGG